MGLVACCLLARQASSTLVSNNLINRLKYYVLQLGDPNPTLVPSPQGVVDAVSVALNTADPEQYLSLMTDEYGPASLEGVCGFVRRCAPLWPRLELGSPSWDPLWPQSVYTIG